MANDGRVTKVLELYIPGLGVVKATTTLRPDGAVRLRIQGGGSYAIQECYLTTDKINILLVPTKFAHEEEKT